jgi:hypothetical protein
MRSCPGWAAGSVLLLLAVGGCGQGPAELRSSGGSGGPPSASGPTPGAGSGDVVSSVSPSSDVGPGATASATGVGGRVSTAAGAPVPTATVVRTPVGASGPLTQQAAVTDLDGRYFWPLTPGAWDIRIEAPGGQSLTQRVVIVEGQRATLDFLMPDG